MSGLSKIAGLPQMKLGWIVVSGPAQLRAEAFERLEWIADTYLSVGTPVQYAAARLLEAGATVQRQIRGADRANLACAARRRAGSPCERAASGRRLVRDGAGAADPHRRGVDAGTARARRACWCSRGSSTISRPRRFWC